MGNVERIYARALIGGGWKAKDARAQNIYHKLFGPVGFRAFEYFFTTTITTALLSFSILVNKIMKEMIETVF